MGTERSEDSRTDEGASEGATTRQTDISADTPDSEGRSEETTEPDGGAASSTAEDMEDAARSTSDADSEEDTQSIEQMLLEFDEQKGLIRNRSLLDPNHVVKEDRIVGRDEQLVVLQCGDRTRSEGLRWKRRSSGLF